MLMAQPNWHQEIIVWGLKTKRHSHRFIHQGFYENFYGLADSVEWLDDSPRINLSPFKKRLIFASGMASKHLPILPNTDYVLHNVHLSHAQEFAAEVLNSRVLRLQVYTNTATGTLISSLPNVKFDKEISTLFQPWGTPLINNNWLRIIEKNTGQTEYWVGSIWNNKAGQGNLEAVGRYKEALAAHGFRFRRIGGSRLTRSGLSETKAAEYLRTSPVGAAIVGDWQSNHGYVPCRLFKNIAAGVPPNSNADFRGMLGSAQLFSPVVGDLVSLVRNESEKSKQNRLTLAQDSIIEYTYKNSINRIFNCLETIR